MITSIFLCIVIPRNYECCLVLGSWKLGESLLTQNSKSWYNVNFWLLGIYTKRWAVYFCFSWPLKVTYFSNQSKQLQPILWPHVQILSALDAAVVVLFTEFLAPLPSAYCFSAALVFSKYGDVLVARLEATFVVLLPLRTFYYRHRQS